MKRGQILLITVMLLATVMTIVLSVSFKSTTETQVTKLEEENQKALAAAESAIEAALKENATATIGIGSLTSITGFSGSATIESLAAATFTTPNIAKNGSYTFYLGPYTVATKTIGASVDQAITICFEDGTPKPAIEITLVKSSSVKKYVVDPIANSSGRIYSTTTITGSSCAPDSTNYSYSINIPGPDATGIGTDGKFLLVKVLFAPTKLLFSRTTTPLPAQGRTISSEATSSTSTGVSKKVVLFQSYPQMPGEFFTTAF
jgi:type II secretory pathway pseudopilin PulG